MHWFNVIIKLDGLEGNLFGEILLTGSSRAQGSWTLVR